MPNVPRRRSELRVAVLANRQVVGDAIALAIGQEDGVRIVVGSTQPTKAGKHAREPDLVVVLGSRADGSTAAATAASRRRWPRTTIIATADSDQLEEGVALLQRGADAWLSRSQGLNDLRGIVARAATGEQPVPPPSVLARMTQTIREAPDQASHVSGRLSSRESQVLACLTAGLPRGEIAETLEISPETVRTHVQHILRKLGVHTVQQAVAMALREASPDIPGA
jgi:DNA-binding NarL/FixJ family response regulator